MKISSVIISTSNSLTESLFCHLLNVIINLQSKYLHTLIPRWYWNWGERKGGKLESIYFLINLKLNKPQENLESALEWKKVDKEERKVFIRKEKKSFFDKLKAGRQI